MIQSSFSTVYSVIVYHSVTELVYEGRNLRKAFNLFKKFENTYEVELWAGDSLIEYRPS